MGGPKNPRLTPIPQLLYTITMDNLPVTQLPATQTDAEPTGVFLLEQFPSATKSHKFTPMQLYNVITQWATSKIQFDIVCETNDIRHQSAYALIEKYPEIRTVYEYARGIHAKMMVEKARDGYNEPPPDAYMVDKFGNRQLSQSWVTYNRDKSNILIRLAQIYETGSTIQTQHIDQHSVNYNINIHSQAPAEIQQASGTLEQLLDE